MRKDLHPNEYRQVVFEDLNSGKQFIVKSCATSKDTTTVDGQEYPLVKIHVSSDSHPFYTGDVKLVDTEGRVDSFERRAKSSQAMKTQIQKKAAKARKLREKRESEAAEAQPEETSKPKGPKATKKAEKTSPEAEKSPAEQPESTPSE